MTIGRFLWASDAPLPVVAVQEGTRPQPSPAPPAHAPARPAAVSAVFCNYVAERRVAEQARIQFESLAMKAAHGDPDALLALPAAASNAREFYKTNWKYEDAAWSAVPGALHDYLADDVLTEQEEAHLDALAAAFGVQVSWTLPEILTVAGVSWWRESTMDVHCPTTALPSSRTQGRPPITHFQG